jgi:hypothetical protein
MRSFLPTARRTAFFLLIIACGARTGLFVDEPIVEGPIEDGGLDGQQPIPDEAGRDVVADVRDALPPIDVRPPSDVDRSDCPDADATLIYTITSTFDLQSFNPATGLFKTIGSIQCPARRGETPFSMAVDRRGVAYVLFTDNRLYRVSTATAACISTPYVPGQSSFLRFGMGFTTTGAGPAEALFVAGDDNQANGGASGLARIDPTTFALTRIDDFSPAIDSAELTGTGDGRLFAFYRKGQDTPPAYIGEVDTTTAKVLGERRFDNIDMGTGWAFAYWGGDFYMFHAPNDTTRVTRWRPSDDSVVQVATSSVKIVGAGVSTCAPQQ